MTEPGLKHHTCSKGNAQKESFSSCLSPLTELAFTYLSAKIPEWFQLHLSRNKPVHIWGNSLSHPVLSACATFLRQPFLLPPREGYMDAGAIEGKVHVLCLYF